MNSAIRPSLNLPQVYLYLKPVDFPFAKVFQVSVQLLNANWDIIPLPDTYMPSPIARETKLNACSGIIPDLYCITKVCRKKNLNGPGATMT